MSARKSALLLIAILVSACQANQWRDPLHAHYQAQNYAHKYTGKHPAVIATFFKSEGCEGDYGLDQYNDPGCDPSICFYAESSRSVHLTAQGNAGVPPQHRPWNDFNDLRDIHAKGPRVRLFGTGDCGGDPFSTVRIPDSEWDICVNLTQPAFSFDFVVMAECHFDDESLTAKRPWSKVSYPVPNKLPDQIDWYDPSSKPLECQFNNFKGEGCEEFFQPPEVPNDKLVNNPIAVVPKPPAPPPP